MPGVVRVSAGGSTRVCNYMDCVVGVVIICRLSRGRRTSVRFNWIMASTEPTVAVVGHQRLLPSSVWPILNEDPCDLVPCIVGVCPRRIDTLVKVQRFSLDQASQHIIRHPLTAGHFIPERDDLPTRTPAPAVD